MAEAATERADDSLRRWHVAALAATLVVYVGIGLVTVVWRRLTGDEGWYTFAAIQVLHGKVPYRDFLFTQTPAVPYVYAAWLAMAGHGILTARLLSFALGGLGVAFTMAAAYRMGGILAGLLAGALLVGNLSFIFEVCSVRTQALTVFLSAVAVWSASREREPWSTPVLFGAAAALLCTRLSMLPVLPFAWALALSSRARRWPAFVWMATSVMLIVATIVAIGSTRNLWFGIVGFHREWYSNPRWNVPLFINVMLSGFLANQWPIVVLFVGALVVLLGRKTLSPAFADDVAGARRWLAFLLASYVTTSAIHFSRPIAYPTYQASNIVFVVAFVGVVWARLCTRVAAAGWVTGSLLAPMMLCALPFQEFAVNWNGEGGVRRVEEVAQFVRSMASGRDPILTPSTEIAVESGLPLRAGWEMSEFAWFPGMEEERARALHVVNRAMLTRDLAEGRAEIVCLTERQVNMMGASDLRNLLQQQYVLRKTYLNYGQFVEPLYVFTRRSDAR